MTASALPRAARAPLAHLRAAQLVGGAWAVIALGLLSAGGSAGRWTAVHVFTLGVVTNLVAALSHHFGQVITRSPERGGALSRLALLNGGALLLLASRVGRRPLLVAGAALLTAGVLWLWWDLRRMRKTSLSPGRLAFVVRAYERATGAFVHGALLGALLGAGVLRGPWYATGRLAHLHVQLLGWAGLALLATLVFLGPTVLRRQIAPGADRQAARALRWGATGLSVGVLALLASASPGVAGTTLRLVAAAGLTAFATAATAVCVPVLRVGRTAPVGAGGLHLLAVCAWFPLAAWADVVVVATGAWWLLEPTGVVFLAGVLAQSILGALSALVPAAWGAGPANRARLRRRLDVAAWPRVLAVNGAVALAALTVMTRTRPPL